MRCIFDASGKRLAFGEVIMRVLIVSVTFAALAATLIPACVSAQDEVELPPLSPLLQGLKTEEARYDIGQQVQFTYAIRNRSDKPIIYTFPNSKHFDLWIERGGKEIYRLSTGKMYAQMITTLTLQPGETKSFQVTWNQKDNDGETVGPGVYTAYAQLTPMRDAPPATSTKFEIGTVRPALVPVTVREAVQRVDQLRGRKVIIAAIYRGTEPDPADPNCKPGPPVTKDDWVIADHTGCLYVNGVAELDPKKNLGARVNVTGELRKTAKGQVYLVLEGATLQQNVTPNSQGTPPAI